MTTSAASEGNVVQATTKEKIKCHICGHENHSLYKHLREEHSLSAEEYLSQHPGADLLSPLGKKVYEEQRAAKAAQSAIGVDESTPGLSVVPDFKEVPFDSIETFGIGFGKASGYTSPKPIRGYEGFTHDDGVPMQDEHYVFPVDTSRDMLMGMMTGGKIYARGPTGSGKTSWFEQFAARTGRPFFRLQFYQEMEDVHLTGNWIVNEKGAMEYMYSGLAQFLRLPSVIVFDEYDSGNPAVTAIANALLEGKPLVLGNKGGERIWPHKDCTIVATGNTTGMGDDTGLYASTTVQSFATMNRFRMFVELNYMPADEETKVLKNRFPKMPDQLSQDMVKFAGLVRDGHSGGSMNAVLSTRQLINWAEFLTMTGDVKRCYEITFANMLGDTDKRVSDELFQRVFGDMT